MKMPNPYRMKLPTFGMPDGYDYLEALLGALGKPYGIEGALYGKVFDLHSINQMDTEYGRIKVK